MDLKLPINVVLLAGSMICGAGASYGIMQARVNATETANKEIVVTFREEVKELRGDMRSLRDAVISLRAEFETERKLRGK